MLTGAMTRPLIIGICGGTGSGKTTITRRIIEALSDTSVVLQQDNYYRDYPGLSFEERVKINFDHPDSMDTTLLAEDVRKLRAGQAIERPTYDFANFQRLRGTVRAELGLGTGGSGGGEGHASLLVTSEERRVCVLREGTLHLRCITCRRLP